LVLYVRDGLKIYEGRRNIPKINALKINEIIKINHYIDKSYYIKILTFEDALKTLSIQEILPGCNTIEEG
jgi:ASC-1-like (ASCH) protein